jgi:Kef-type K+ transport system membrane component KefB
MSPINEPAGVFALAMALAVAAPYLSDYTGIPVVASMIVAGIVLGPRVTGIMPPGMAPEFLGSAGLLYAFFAAASEINVTAIRKRSSRVWIFAALTFLVPFASGFGLAMLLHRSFRASLLLGAFFASSGAAGGAGTMRSDIAFRESTETGRAGAGMSRIAAALILLFTLTVPDNVAAAGMLKTAAGALLAILYFGGLYLLVPRILSSVLGKTRIQGGIDTIFTMFLLFGSAALAGLAGLPPAIGAFWVGLLVAPRLAAAKTVAASVRLLGDSFFYPFLFILIGSQMEFSASAGDFPVLPLIALTVVLAIGSKLLAAWAAGRILGYSAPDRGLLFAATSAFGTLSLSIAHVAGRSGAFDRLLVNDAIFLAVISSAASSLVFRSSASSIFLKRFPQDKKRHLRAERIVVALSKPSTAHHLMELGMMLHGPESQAPVIPLSIIPETATDGDSRQHAETMLAAAILQGVSSQIPVIPVSRIEVNAARGILESAEEQGADTIIVGWNRPPRLANAFFGSVIDQIVNGGSHMVFVARAVAPFTASHIVAMVPALCDLHEGFPAAVRSLTMLARKSQARLHLLTLKGNGSGLAKAFRNEGYPAPIQIVELDAWKDAGRAIRALPPVPKIITILSARPSEPSWHPAIERLPHRIGEQYPESNLIVLYMPTGWTDPSALPDTGAAPKSTRPVPNPRRILEEAIAGGTVRVDMRHTAIAEGIFELVSSAFPFDRKLSSRLGTRLTEIVQRQPIEIQPGVVLVHDRVEGMKAPVVCFGSRRDGFRIALLERPVKVLVLILVPEAQSPESHLAFLGELAGLFRNGELMDQLLVANEPEELLSGSHA